MSFLTPTLLGWLAAAAVPLLIHLLARRQYRRVTWAAMEFLLAARKKTARRVRLEQFLLLSLRTLIVAVAVLAVANPSGCGAGPLSAALGTLRHHLLLIDNTLSTRYREGDQAVFDRIRETAEKLLDAAPPGSSDAYTILTLARPAGAEIALPSRARDEIAGALQRLEPTEAVSDPAAALQRAAELLAGQDGQFDEQIVYVLTDNAKSAWSASAEPDRALPALVRKLVGPGPAATDAAAMKPVRFVVVDLGPREPLRNLSVTRLDCETLSETEREVNRSGIPVTVTVKNAGEVAADGVRVRLSSRPDVTMVRAVSEPLSLKPGQTATAAFSVQFQAGGSHVFTAELVADAGRPWSDGLADDDVRRLSVMVHRKLPVLLLDGEPGASPINRETVFLRAALSAGPDDNDAAALFAPESVAYTPQEARTADLSRRALVVAANVESPDPVFARRLRKYVWDGGAAVIFLGSRVIASDYNERFVDPPAPGSDETGLHLTDPFLPGALGREMTADADAAGAGEPFRFVYPRGRSEPHPVAAFLPASEAEKALETCGTRRYLKIDIPPQAAGVERVFDFNTGDPAVVVKRFGRGRVALVTTSADADWSTFGTRPVLFVPVMRRLALHLLGGPLAGSYNRDVGDPLDYAPRFGDRPTRPLLERLDPAGAVTVEAASAPDGSSVRVERLTRAGTYRLSSAGDPARPRTYFAVNVDPIEGEPARLDRTELEKTLGLADEASPDVRERFQLIAEPAELDALTAGQAGGGLRLGRQLLCLLLVLMLMESALARRFDRLRAGE